MTVFERIEEEIEKQGITRSELSRRANVGESTLRAWKTTEPKARMLYDVAKALGVSLEYLLTGEKKEEAPKTPFIPLPKDISRQDLSDIKYFAGVYPSLMPSEKQMIMACLGAAEKPTAESSLNTA